MKLLEACKVGLGVICLIAAGVVAINTYQTPAVDRTTGLATTHSLGLAVIGSDTLDLGKLRQGEPVATSFEIRNVTDTMITIHGVSSTCGCTVPTIDATLVPVGGVARVDVKFNTVGVRGDSTQWVGVRFSQGPDSTIDELSVQIKATVDPDYDVTPSAANLFSNNRVVQEFTIDPKHYNQLQLTSLLVDRPWFHVTHRPSAKLNSYVVCIVFDPTRYDSLAGQASLTITTNSPGQPTFNMTLAVSSAAIN